jgi:clan AA aspartic protease (TIGR02281 family)
VIETGSRLADGTPVTATAIHHAPADAATRKESVCGKTIIAERTPVKDSRGYAKYDPKTSKPITEPVMGIVHCCPKCGQIARNSKGSPLSKKDVTNFGARATQKRCTGTLLKSIWSPEKPTLPGGETIPIETPKPYASPDKITEKDRDGAAHFKGRKPGTKVKYAGREWEIVECKEPLYNYKAKPYRWSPSRIMQKQLKRMFQYLIVDEIHEHKSDESAQSMACSKLIGAVDHVLGLTGTIIGGYAHHLYALMMRITPRSLREEGFEWGKDLDFAKIYGRIKVTVKTTEEGYDPSVHGKAKSMRKAKGKGNARASIDPGVMPTMFARHMMGNSIFITLEELADNLPDLFEYVGGHVAPEEPRQIGESQDDFDGRLDFHGRNEDGWFETAVDMESDQRAEYDRVMSILEIECKQLLQRGSMKLLGAMLWTGLDYPDRPFGWGHDSEVKKAMAEAGEDKVPPLLGQSFLKHFDHRFDPETETSSLTKDGETSRIPLVKDGGVYWLDVTFNGSKTRRLVYDTGASNVSISEAMALDLGLPRKASDYDSTSQIADGSVVPNRMTKIDSLKVGKFSVADVECCIQAIKLPHTIGYWDKKGSKKLDNWRGVVTPRDCPKEQVYPKEQRLIDICQKQKADSRQTWVYVNMTGKRNIQPRLKKLLEAEGLKVGVLRSDTVEPIEREQWIEENGRDYDVMLSHPELVKTGLDLFSKKQGGHNYSTIVFYETGYNLFTMRQAARRAWRIGQPQDCRVYYLYYRDCMQAKAMQLMSRKMAASQALEGEFSEDGLAALAGEDNMQMALAKKLSERISESDMQRNWGKVQSNPKKKAIAQAKALDRLTEDQQAEVNAATAAQMVAETIEEHDPGFRFTESKVAFTEKYRFTDPVDSDDGGWADEDYEDVVDEKELDEETGEEFELLPKPLAEKAAKVFEGKLDALVADLEETFGGEPAFSEDKCRECGKHLGFGIPEFHLGICEECDESSQEEADVPMQVVELGNGSRVAFDAEREHAEKVAEQFNGKVVTPEPEDDDPDHVPDWVREYDPDDGPIEDDEPEDDDPWDDDDDDDDDFVVPEMTPEIIAKMFANMAQHGIK